MDLLIGKQIFQNEREVLILNGLVNDNLTAPLVSLNAETISNNKSLLKRLSYFTIECFQNVIRHGYQVQGEKTKMTKGMFAYINSQDTISVYTSNEVPIDHAISFEEKLDDLRVLSIDDLKSLYMNTLDSSELSDAGGAGLGLIDILRKTKGKVQFEYTPEVSGWSNFMFETVVKGDKRPAQLGTNDYQSFMDSNELILFRQGVFTRNGLLFICQLISLKLKINKHVDRNYYLFAILELVQNVTEHSASQFSNQDCMFLKRTKENKFWFSTGNTVEINKVDEITEKLNRINSFSKAELQSEYERQMARSLVRYLGDTELGWLKIRKKLGSIIHFRFEEHSETHKFFYVSMSTE